MKFYDISYTLSNNTPIYPGNPDFNIERFLEIPKDQSNVSLVSFGTHTATHIDAPFHVNNEGQTIDKINIERFFGKCNVLDISFSKNKITREDLEKYEIKNDFLLIKTNNSNIGFDEFHEDFIYLDLSAAEYIKEKGIKFIGVDGPSVKKFHEKDLIHEFFFKKRGKKR